MIGRRLSSAAKKLDVVVVAARYAPDGNLALAQVYERRGQVWTDLVLFDREDLVQRLRAGKRVAAGVPAQVPGDFEVRESVRLSGVNGRAVVRAEGATSTTDDLRVPAF
ncbi:MAG TPA: hypothetical protein VFI11_14675 [Anaerolineales bacterium]|nr:hypothetical protein [Anaerolineales bacterium]